MSEEELQTAEQSVEPEMGSESAPDSEGQHDEKVTLSEEVKALLSQEIGKKTKTFRERERELERQLEDERKAREELAARVPTQTRPEIPPIPDQFDDDFEQQVIAREEAIRKAAEFDAAQDAKRQFEAEQQEAQQAQQAKSVVEAAESYAGRAKTLGVSPEELQAAGQVVNQYGIPDTVAETVLYDEKGPLITKYLSQNLPELDSLVRAPNDFQRGLIFTEIKSKAAALSAKTSDAPPPPDELKGGGMPRRDWGPDGLQLE